MNPADRKRKQRASSRTKANQGIRNARKKTRRVQEITLERLSAEQAPTTTGSTLPTSTNRQQPSSFNTETVRQRAWNNIAQFRAEPDGHTQFETKVALEMDQIRDRIKIDMTNHESAINPVHFSVCASCGHSVQNYVSIQPSSDTLHSWLNILQDKIFGFDSENLSLRFCPTCANSLRRKKVPFGAKCRGWPFDQEVPTELKLLTQYERQLICLRLPCVYIWRTQGGFGQYGCRGPPISFSNPLSEVARSLPRYPSKVFRVFLEGGQHVDIDKERTYNALCWLRHNNPLYKDVHIDFDALQDIAELQQARNEASAPTQDMNSTPRSSVATEETLSRGTQGPIDMEGLEELSRTALTGMDDSNNVYHAQLLIRHMLRPFKHRRSHIIPSYDATINLESYFPVLFPCGNGGPATLSTKLALWVKHVLSVQGSRFCADLDFIFFVYSVMKRRRLTGLATFAPIRSVSSRGILEVREMLSSSLPDYVITKRIDTMLRSGTLNASFETLRGSPAFWARLKRTSWAYLTSFGPCQLFMTISAADLMDPYVYCQIDPSLSFDQARQLSSRQRADLLASNPVSATTIFHRRISSIFRNFLFGESKPFGKVVAYLGRIEQQSRLSPHLHLLIWLQKTAPDLCNNISTSAEEIAEFIEQFCTALLPADTLTPQSEVPDPIQIIPPPKYIPLAHDNFSTSFELSASERHEFLSRPYNSNAFDGSVTSNRELRGQIMATQLHHCNTYCRQNNSSCRFNFPFPLQLRASVASRTNDPSDPRSLALSPRSTPNLNSTHPLLTAMCHANTDVTVITGSSIPESMYVCSYAVKAEKHPMFDRNALRKLKTMDDEGDERKLLGALARHSSCVRTVGAQEAVDFLLDNPLIFCSAKVQNVDPSFLLRHPSALSVQERSRYDLNEESSKADAEQNLLSKLDVDEAAAVPSYTANQYVRTKRGVDGFLTLYMRRPAMLEHLSASAFHELYEIRRLRKSRVNFDPTLVFMPASAPTSRKNEGTFIAQKRKNDRKGPNSRNILNVVCRGQADDDSPFFAAAALSLHVPFRSVPELLCGLTLTQHLRQLLQSKDYPQLNRYVLNAHDLANAQSNPIPRQIRANNTADNQDELPDEQSNSDDEMGSMLITEDDEISANPLAGLSPTLAAEGYVDPLSVRKQWSGNSIFGQTQSFQFDRFRHYLNECKQNGLLVANRNIAAVTDANNTGNIFGPSDADMGITISGPTNRNFPDPMDVLLKKQSILGSTRNAEQRILLEQVVCYLQVYYARDPTAIPAAMIHRCKQNHPLFINAPGGCGKSWLLSQIENFLSTCVPHTTLPVWVFENYESGITNVETSDIQITVSRSEMAKGRLGTVAVFAASGVAAGNANGFTFHNGLRSHHISYKDFLEGPSPEVHAQLLKDFAHVLLIVIEEYSMAAFLLIAYVDSVARSVRTAFSSVPFGGIPVVITGDGLQLPVVGSYGLLSNPSCIPDALQDLHRHCTKGMFCLKLSKSVRQEEDREFAEILLRMRVAASTEEDVAVLNTRYVPDFKKLSEESPDWTYAPILTARNQTVTALNNAAIHRNGSSLGTFHIRSLPVSTRSMSSERIKRIMKSHVSKRIQKAPSRTNSSFTPAPVTVLYPGMPVMLRWNVCPSLGLSNGSIGRVIAVIHEDETVLPHETKEESFQRYVSGSRAVPSVLVSFSQSYRGAIGALSTTSQDVSLQRQAKHTVILQPTIIGRLKGLPITPAHAITMHKSHSLTLPHSIIDPRGTFCMGALYVAFSRSPSLQRIALIARVTVAEISKFSSQVQKVLERLAEIEAASNTLEPFVSFVSNQERYINNM